LSDFSHSLSLDASGSEGIADFGLRIADLK